MVESLLHCLKLLRFLKEKGGKVFPWGEYLLGGEGLGGSGGRSLFSG
ncbi:hypothetical protein K4A83_19575 [Spirulina subsalsa FACHB-351]|uniref:Uncharacterized protein n=2 Tax=Spirulina subsalsa TaxID=54311 RepID=A0ABT3LBV0_9CYAN|nr:hypothetical protein [Spirulina subsalsa FACHB-351]